jgi:hypothetical protein
MQSHEPRADMRRREFITLIGGAASWPLAARAQQPERVRRIGVLENKAATDPESPKEMTALLGGLQERGWTLGGNLQIEYRWGAGDANLYRKYAAELVARQRAKKVTPITLMDLVRRDEN